MQRNLLLTSPATRGQDIVDLERAINALGSFDFNHHVAVDGIFGPVLHHMVAVAAFHLGLSHYEATAAVQHYIMHPHLRNPGQLALAAERRQRREHLSAITDGQVGVAAALAYAAHFVGVAEDPAGSNWGRPQPAGWEERCGIHQDSNGDGVSWCGAAARAFAEAGGAHLTDRMLYVPWVVADAHSRTGGFEAWIDDHAKARPGDLPCYDWNGDGTADHIGMGRMFFVDHLEAFEGNTSGTNPSDGGQVALMMRTYRFVMGYARPRYLVI